MKMTFLEEMTLRGMVHQTTPNIDKQFNSDSPVTAYIGFDPTAESLHVGSLLPLMSLRLFKKHGHQPIVLIGGATASIGDPSGKSKERNLLGNSEVLENAHKIAAQIRRVLGNDVKIVDNSTWMNHIGFIDFIRIVGKHVNVSQMLARDSVKSRIGTGLSFTEFSYQLVQGYDFKMLFDAFNCTLQMGGSDQYGNMCVGLDLIKSMPDIDDTIFQKPPQVDVLTMPLVTKSDGTKFGKTENGTVFLDAKLTSPYQFYQFWVNTPDKEAETYIKYFSSESMDAIASMIASHRENPELRILQKQLAKEMTSLIHGADKCNQIIDACEQLFSKDFHLDSIDSDVFEDIISDTPRVLVSKETKLIDALVQDKAIFPSKNEVRRMITGGGLSINKSKCIEAPKDTDKVMEAVDGTYVNSTFVYTLDNIQTKDLSHFSVHTKYVVVQKGKKNMFIIELV